MKVKATGPADGEKIYILFHTNLKLKVLTLNLRYLVNSFGTHCLSSRMCIKTQKPESISWSQSLNIINFFIFIFFQVVEVYAMELGKLHLSSDQTSSNSVLSVFPTPLLAFKITCSKYVIILHSQTEN